MDALKIAIAKALVIIDQDSVSKNDVRKAIQDLNTAIVGLKEKPIKPIELRVVLPVVEDKDEIIEGKNAIVKVDKDAI